MEQYNEKKRGFRWKILANVLNKDKKNEARKKKYWEGIVKEVWEKLQGALSEKPFQECQGTRKRKKAKKSLTCSRYLIACRVVFASVEVDCAGLSLLLKTRVVTCFVSANHELCSNLSSLSLGSRLRDWHRLYIWKVGKINGNESKVVCNHELTMSRTEFPQGRALGKPKLPTGSTSSFTSPLGKILYSIVFLQTKRLCLGSQIGTGIPAPLLILVFSSCCYCCSCSNHFLGLVYYSYFVDLYLSPGSLGESCTQFPYF